MTTSYLFAYYTLDSQVSLYSCLFSTDLFFFLTFRCIITLVSGIIDHYCITENLKKKSGENNKLRTIYSKNQKILRTTSLGPVLLVLIKNKSVMNLQLTVENFFFSPSPT